MIAFRFPDSNSGSVSDLRIGGRLGLVVQTLGRPSKHTNPGSVPLTSSVSSRIVVYAHGLLILNTPLSPRPPLTPSHTRSLKYSPGEKLRNFVKTTHRCSSFYQDASTKSLQAEGSSFVEGSPVNVQSALRMRETAQRTREKRAHCVCKVLNDQLC